MKKFCITFLLSGIIILSAIGLIRGFGQEKTSYDDFLRIHVRANSNSEEDQAVKYLVRDEIVAYLTPLVASSHTRAEAKAAVEKNLSAISAVAEKALMQRGFFYGAKAEVKNEEFPTRVYENITLEAGRYEALIVNLGSGKGDNWWCVVYPPLCFSGTSEQEIVYKSKIREIIEEFKQRAR